MKARDTSGAVAAVALVMAGAGYQRVWVANCGDVRVVLDDGTNAQTISHDHTLSRSSDVGASDAANSGAEAEAEAEAARVVAAGGRLTLTLDGYRRVLGAEGVLGGLQVTIMLTRTAPLTHTTHTGQSKARITWFQLPFNRLLPLPTNSLD